MEEKIKKGKVYAACLVAVLAAGGLLFFHAASTRAESNFVGYWKFDESSAGTTAVDQSGNHNDLTPVNNPLPSVDTPTALGTNFADPYSTKLNGTNQYFSISDNASLDNTTSGLSIAIWVKFTTVNNTYQSIVSKWNVGAQQQWTLQLNADNHIGWWTGDGGTAADDLEAGTTISPGTWYHIVATYEGLTKKIYINGAFASSTTSSVTMGAASGVGVGIGAKTAGSPEYMDGLVDDVRIYNYTLTDGEISQLAAGVDVPPDTTGPTTPGTPSASTPSNDNTPTFNWTGSTDISGLATIAYTVEWSQDTNFSGLGGIAGITGNSYTIPDGLSMSDGTWYFRAMATDAHGNNSAWSDYATIHIDTTAPVISSVAATNGASTGQETITWTTDKNTSSKVSYGPTTGLGANTAETDTSPRVTSHSVTLDNLVACSIYHFTVTSQDAAGNTVTSGDQSFITNGCAGSADIIAHADQPITTASGGTASLDTISISVPANFAGSNADFQIKKINHDIALEAIGMPAGTILAGNQVYDIKALLDGMTTLTTFDHPITVTLQYGDADITALVESSLAIYRWDDGVGWTKLSNCSVNAAARTVTCTTTHFSTFALYGQSKSAPSGTNRASNDIVAVASDTTVPTEDAPASNNDNSSRSSANTINNDTAQKDLSSQDFNLFQNLGWWLLGVAAIISFGWFVMARHRHKKKTNL